MTALLVLRPGLSDTVNRAVARTIGTLAGAMLASFSLAHLAPAPPTLAVLSLFFAWLAYSLNNVNYGLFTLCLTAYLVNLLALASLPGNVVAYHRAISTMIGGGLALTVRLLVIRYRQKHSHATHVPKALKFCRLQSKGLPSGPLLTEKPHFLL